MPRELEFIGAGALGALLQRKAKHAPPPGSACANCDTPLAGPYCHVCGQDADDHHRSIGRLAWEGVESLTHLDGRLGQTLPLLLFQPGKLARDQLEGRRARHVPPFRLFLISLLIFMFVLEGLLHPQVIDANGGPSASDIGFNEAAGPAPTAQTLTVGISPKDLQDAAITSQQAVQDTAEPPAAKGSHAHGSARGTWLRDHIKRAVANQEYYKLVLFTWAHRLAILLLPILAGLLALTYVRSKQFFVYDHLIVGMQFLSFEFLIFAIAWLFPGPLVMATLLIATLWSPVNLFMTLRGAYGSGPITAGVKSLFLWSATLFLFVMLMAGLLVLALSQM